MVQVSFGNAMSMPMVVLLATQVAGFWRMSCSVVQMGRIDPVLSFGSVSQHAHKISGASNININSTYDSLRAAPCTSCQIQADKSAYWNPQLYYLHADGQYEEVLNGGMAVYYLGRGYDGHGGSVASPFPPGLKFLSGDSNARSYSTTLTYNGNATYPGVPVGNRVTFACIDYNNPMAQTNYMSNTNCPDGLRAQIDFQSCWDGVNLYKSDQSHVDYLSQIDNGVCPPSHPVLLPHIFIEILYSVTSINQDGGKFVFSNGDETGYGFHGDFINGWDIPTLTAAIENCLIGVPDGVVEECPAFRASDNTNFATFCPETSPIFPCEPVHGKIAKLPGCITPTGFNHVEVSADNTCSGGNVAACSPNYFNGPPAPYGGNSEYQYLGCYTEATNGRLLTGAQEITSNMTAENCIAFCAGSTYVGVEYTSECYCGSSECSNSLSGIELRNTGQTLNVGSVSAASDDCGMTCSGNPWEVCGGSNRLNIFKHT